MRFKLSVTPETGHDIVTAQIVFEAAHWPAAKIASTKIVEQLGFRMEQVSTLVTLADRNEEAA